MRSAGKAVILSIILAAFIAGLLSGQAFRDKGPVDIGRGQALSLTDREYFPTVREAISSANGSIRMVMFDIRYYPDYPESPGNLLIGLLGDAAERGVDVRMIADEWLTEKPVLSMLRERGVCIKYDSGETTTHAKLIIIDSEIVIIGSTNWSYHSFEENHEANAVIRSEELAGQFIDYFEKIWSES